MNGTLRRTLVAGVLASFLLAGSTPQDKPSSNVRSLGPGETSPMAKIEEVAWMAGHWRGKALGGTAEEIWSPPAGHTMMGMYRLIKDDAVVFYELMTIAEEKGTLVLRLKHFHPDMKGWEEKDEAVTFPLVKLEPKAVYFDGLTIRRAVDDKLQIFVRHRRSDGSTGELAFPYDRVK